MRFLGSLFCFFASWVFWQAFSLPYNREGLLGSHDLELLMRACFFILWFLTACIASLMALSGPKPVTK